MLAVIIPDREAPDMEIVARVIGAGESGGAGIERHCHGEDLEDRTQLVNAERVAVEHSVRDGQVGMVRIRGARMVRVEIGQRHHRKHFAGVDVHDQPGGAFRGEVVDDPLQLLPEDVLEAQVERQLQGLLPVLQRAVEPALDPGEAGIVDPGIADDMRRQCPIRIDATLFVLELNSRNAELIDRVLFMRRQMAFQVYKALARSELGVHFQGLEAWERLYQFAGRVRWVEDLLRIGVDRGAVERRGEKPAVAVDNVGAGGRRRCRNPEPGHM